MYYQNQYFDGNNYSELIPQTTKNALTLNRKTASELSEEILFETKSSFVKVIDAEVNYTYTRQSRNSNNPVIPVGTSFLNAVAILYKFSIVSMQCTSYKSSDFSILSLGFSSASDYSSSPYIVAYNSSSPAQISSITITEKLNLSLSQKLEGRSYIVNVPNRGSCSCSSSWITTTELSFFNNQYYVDNSFATGHLSCWIQYVNL